jgi:hypothetical protein
VGGAGHAGAYALELFEIERGGDVADLVLGLGDDMVQGIGDQRVPLGLLAAEAGKCSAGVAGSSGRARTDAGSVLERSPAYQVVWVGQRSAPLT